MKIIYTDVLVIGGGLAGLRLAIGAKRRGHEAIILSLVPAKRSHSKAAQGGMQASLGNVIKGQGDNEDVHFEDTVRGSDWGADQRVVRMFVNTAPKAVRELAAWGVPWSRVRKGDREVIINGQKVTITERDEAHGLLAQRDFGGTKKWRTCYVSDGTGHAMITAMADQAIAASIPVHERTEALALIHDGGRCYGAVVRDLITGQLIAYVAKATAIATGGAGRLYRVTTNAVICEGIGHAIALETGVATLGNMEAVQFHPTGIFPAGILVTEGCRGDGGLLKDVDGHRFMPDYEPEKKELASRDVVSRRMEEHIAKGKGVPRTASASTSGSTSRCWASTTSSTTCARSTRSATTFSASTRSRSGSRCARPSTTRWAACAPRRPARARRLKGLFAAGEAACWDMHGFNRLGGNSVAETVVAGMIVGEFISRLLRPIRERRRHPDRPGARALSSASRPSSTAMLTGGGTEDAMDLRVAMQQIMTAKVGIFRRGADLEQAVEELQALLVRSRNIGVRSRAAGANPELVTAYRTQKMLKLAVTRRLRRPRRAPKAAARISAKTIRAATTREWLKRTLASWANEQDTLPTLRYETARREDDGAAARLARVWRQGLHRPSRHRRRDSRKSMLSGRSWQPAGRFAVQKALLPYEDLLPPRFRGPNERIDERF